MKKVLVLAILLSMLVALTSCADMANTGKRWKG